MIEQKELVHMISCRIFLVSSAEFWRRHVWKKLTGSSLSIERLFFNGGGLAETFQKVRKTHVFLAFLSLLSPANVFVVLRRW